jgi:hypothetical protein
MTRHHDGFALGDIARDTITGYTGGITSIMDRLGTFESMIQLEARAGTQPPSQWFPESRLTPITGEALSPDATIAALQERIDSLDGDNAVLQDLLEDTICACTLVKRCPQHRPERPKR